MPRVRFAPLPPTFLEGTSWLAAGARLENVLTRSRRFESGPFRQEETRIVRWPQPFAKRSACNSEHCRGSTSLLRQRAW